MSTEPATAPTGRPLRADARRNYEQIVAAAREVLREQGATASLEEIARRAGVGIGTLYRRFPNRLDLLEAVYREDVDALRTQTQRLLAEAEPWPAVEQFVAAVLEYAATKRALFAELVEAIGRDSELLTHSRAVINSCAETVLERGKAAGVVRPDVTPADVIRLVAGCSMMGTLDAAQAERVAGIVLAGIRA